MSDPDTIEKESRIAERVRGFRSGADLPDKMNAWAEKYYWADDEERDRRKGYKFALQGAKLGQPASEFTVGYAHYTGDGAKRDYEEAFRWLQKASADGFADADYLIGSCLFLGQGCEANEQEAVAWLRKTAKRGSIIAMYNLAGCYEDARGVRRNARKAFEFYAKAAEQGFTPAKYHLGLCYLNGIGVEKNEETAVDWLVQAERMEHPGAMCELGDIAYKGDDLKGAILYILTAKWHRNPRARRLASAYKLDEGAPFIEEKYSARLDPFSDFSLAKYGVIWP